MSVSNRRSAPLRYLSLFLALVIFVLASSVELMHDDDDYKWVAAGQIRFNWSVPKPPEPRHVCLACLMIQAFQTARIVWFFLLFIVMAVSLCRGSREPEFHSSFLFGGCRIRAPPFPSSDFSGL